MVERKVSFGIDLSPGVAQLRTQLASVTELSKRSLLQIQQAEERHTQKLSELRRSLKKIDEDANSSSIAAHRRMVERIESEEQNHQLRMKQMKERAQLQSMESQRGGFNLSAMGHIAQSMGFYRTGHLIRAFNDMGMGTQIFSGGGGSAGGKAIGAAGARGMAGAAEGAGAGLGEGAGMAAAEAGAGVALAPETLGLSLVVAAVIAGGSLIETAFKGVASAATSLATAFLGGVAQIGGAKGLQEMVAESAEMQRRTGIARLTVSPEERMTQKEMDDLAGSLSQNAELGGFSREKWVAAMNEMGTVSGKQKSFDRQSWEFIGRMGNVSGMDPAEAAKVYGTLQYTNPNMNNSQIQNLLLSSMGIGRELTFSSAELPTAGRVIQSSGRIGGQDRELALRKSMVLAGLMKPYTASGTLGEAGTMEEALLRQMTRASNAGTSQIKTNKLGQVTNLNQALGWVLSTPEKNLPKALLERESGEAIHALKMKAGITDADTAAQTTKKVDEMIEKYTKLGLSMDQFIKESEGATGSSQRIKASFNTLTENIEGRLIKLLESDQFQKALQNIIDFLMANGPTLESAIEDMIIAFNKLAPAVWAMTETFFDIMGWIAKQPVFATLFPELAKQIQGLAQGFAEARNQHDLREKFQNAEYPSDFIGPLPPGAHKAKPETVSVPVVHRPEKMEDPNTKHLETLKTLQQKQIDVLNAIRANTMPPPPGAPKSSHDGH